MFRQLSKNEAAEFRLWARRNYAPGTEISEVWHPVVQDECRRMCEENGVRFDADSDKRAKRVLALKD
jgi:hypothetical protein